MKFKAVLYTFALMSALALLLVGSLMAVGFDAGPAQASPHTQAEAMPRTITVVGEGQVSAPADLAVVNMGVQVSDPDVQQATQQAAEQMESLLTALKEIGIAGDDIQTSYYSLYVDRPFGPQGSAGEANYQLSNTLQVTVRDLDSLTELLGAAIESGANNINNIEFKLADTVPLRSDARSAAIDNAQARANELAELSGVTLGNVVSVSEVVDSGAYFVSEQSYAAAPGGGLGGGGPISAGEVNVNVQLQVVYEIVQ